MAHPDNNLGAVRTLSAALVVVGHSFALLGIPSPGWYGWPIQAFAVMGFFVISGYLVSESWVRDPHLGRFLMRRGLRILPGLAAVLVLSMLVLGPIFTRLPLPEYLRHPGTWAHLWGLAMAPTYVLPGVFVGLPVPVVNGALWSLPIEVAMYLLVPLYAWPRLMVWRRVLLPALLVATAVASFLFTVVYDHQVQPVVWASSIPFGLRYMWFFVLGAAVRLYGLERFLNTQAAMLLLAGLGVIGGAPWVVAALVMGVAPYALLSFGLTRAPLLGWVGRRADVSYGIYLWGFPVQQALIAVFGVSIGPLLLTAVGLPLAALMGFLSWHLIESPALRWKPRARSASIQAIPA